MKRTRCNRAPAGVLLLNKLNNPFNFGIGEKIKILLNTNGVFTTKELALNSEYYGSVTAGDVDNDGDLDLFITTNQSINKFMINDGKANFTYDKELYPNTLYNKGFFASELYDMDNDGYLDLVTAGH